VEHADRVEVKTRKRVQNARSQCLSASAKMPYRRGIFFIVFKKDKNKVKYLLLKRKLHWKGWEISKGGIEKNENYKQGLLRELKEETGAKPVKIIDFHKTGKFKYEKELPDRKGIIGQTYKLYSVEINTDKVKYDKYEHSGYKWVDFKTAYKMLTWTDQKKCLKLVHSKT